MFQVCGRKPLHCAHSIDLGGWVTAIAGHLMGKRAGPEYRVLRQEMLQRIAVRGEVSQFVEGEIALFHADSGDGLRTCAFEVDEYPVIVAGDLRIDNRDDLLRALGGVVGRDRTDADVVRRAFLRWGASCFERLIGDFSIAIWDKRDGSLYCCRDHFGVRPLFYQSFAGAFAFATEAKMLPAFEEGSVSEAYLANFIANIPNGGADTAYRGIQRLLPGHWLRWQDGALTVSQYWKLQVNEVQSPDPVEEFRELFTRAVSDRMSDSSRLVSLLSGGLDSSAITAVAERVSGRHGDSAALKTFSIVYDNNPLINERRYIEDLLAKGRYQPRFLNMDRYQPLQGMNELLRVQEGPFNAPGLLKTTRMFRSAAEGGVQVILDGHGGDEVVGYGTGRLWEYALAGKWLDLIPLVRTHCRLGNSSALQSYQQLLERYGSNHYHTRAIRWVLRHFLADSIRDKQQRAMAWEIYTLPSYAEKMELTHRSRAGFVLSYAQRTSDQHYQLKGLTSPLIGTAFELLDKSSAAAGLEVRYPFYDVRLVEFCLGLDSSEKLRRNETRSILRRAMGDLYPRSIAKRQDKTNFGPEIAVGLVRYHDDLLEEMAEDSYGWLAQYFDMDRLRNGLEALKQDPLKVDGGDLQFFWRTAILYLWMKQTET